MDSIALGKNNKGEPTTMEMLEKQQGKRGYSIYPCGNRILLTFEDLIPITKS
jgi:hypothetical protein